MSIREHTHMQNNLLPQALEMLLKDGTQIENMKTIKATGYPFFL